MVMVGGVGAIVVHNIIALGSTLGARSALSRVSGPTGPLAAVVAATREGVIAPLLALNPDLGSVGGCPGSLVLKQLGELLLQV